MVFHSLFLLFSFSFFLLFFPHVQYIFLSFLSVRGWVQRMVQRMVQRVWRVCGNDVYCRFRSATDC